MKKHIKKIICLVSVLVLCISATIVPCLAYEITEPTGEIYYSAFQPTVSVTYDNGDGYIQDKISNYAYEGFSFWSDALYVDQIFEQAGNGLVVEYKLMPHIGANETWTIDSGVLAVSDVYHLENWLVTLGADSTVYLRYEGLIDNDVEKGEFVIEYDVNGGTFSLNQEVTERLGRNWEGYIQVYITTEIPGSVRIRQYYYTGDTLLADIRFRSVSYTDALFIESVKIDKVPIGDFLWNSVTGFLSFELVPGVSLYMILIVLVSVPLCVWVLKLIAGG